MKSFFNRSGYSLRKAKHVLRHFAHLYKKKKKRLLPPVQATLRSALESLQNAILAEDRKNATLAAQRVEELARQHLKKKPFEAFFDFIVGFGIALVIAIIVRQVWFELYEIPTGSMRPTFKEQDRLVVSKTDFGINVPLTPEHLYFDPELVKRSGIAIFTVENLDVRDPDTLYFYLFPGKKQYIKRIMGKPGDTLYFYGGNIYGFDGQGRDISPELQPPQLNNIEHIPFIRFEGNAAVSPSSSQGIYSPVVLYQMNEPVARLSAEGQNSLKGEMLQGKPFIRDIGDLWGIKNFGMARLLTKEQVKQFTDQNPTEMEEGVLYLEIKHHPSLLFPKLIRDEMGRLRPGLNISTSIIPLQERHVRALFNNLYTARFVVKNGYARRYDASVKEGGEQLLLPQLPNVPNGTYEFYYGTAYEVLWQGITKELPANHPLYRFDPARLQLLFNLGIQFDTRFSPQAKHQRLIPSRYTYYRDKDLYLLGAPLLKSDDPTLTSFLEREKKRASTATLKAPYQPFEDLGPPLQPNGELDIDFIRTHGLTLPPQMYLALGDNHAMSSDSRDFGFVPAPNLRGAPDFIFWPPGSRWGKPNQPSYPFLPLPRLLIWIVAAIGCSSWYYVHRKRNRLPLSFD